IRAEPRLDPGSGVLACRPLLVDRRITEAAEDETEIRSLLPVVEAIARIMRAGVKLLPERRGHDDLATRRTDGAVELLDETLRVAVGRTKGWLCVEPVERRAPMGLADPSTGLGGPRRAPPHPARRVKRPVGRVEERPRKTAGETAAELGPPLRGEAV